MPVFFWLGALLLVGAGGHARLHPADPDVYVEVPDVAALARAYADAPLVHLLAVPEMAKLRNATGLDALQPAQLMLSMLKPRRDVDVDEALAAWSEITRASLSVSGLEDGARRTVWGALLVLDFGSAETATRAASLFDAIESVEPIPVDGGDDTRKIEIDGETLPFVRRRWRTELAWTRRVDGQTVHYAESSFGPETPLAFLALAVAASQWGTRRALEIGGAQSKESTLDLAPAAGLAQASDLERERTEARLREVRTGLAVFKSTQGGLHPTTLDHLVVPTDSFPKGFLDGASVPQDAWGRELVYTRLDQGRAYTLWSRGPDGVDQDGRGDDVRVP